MHTFGYLVPTGLGKQIPTIFVAQFDSQYSHSSLFMTLNPFDHNDDRLHVIMLADESILSLDGDEISLRAYMDITTKDKVQYWERMNNLVRKLFNVEPSWFNSGRGMNIQQHDPVDTLTEMSLIDQYWHMREVLDNAPVHDAWKDKHKHKPKSLANFGKIC